MIHIGEKDGYFWAVRPQTKGLIDIVLESHKGLRLCIVAFDGGEIHPVADEMAAGWRAQGKAMVSPPLERGVVVPQADRDEWYIVAEPQFDQLQIETFVNYFGFTLVPPNELYKDMDPTWDRTKWDFLIPLQEKFWSQLKAIRPQTFVSMGDEDVLVSTDRTFIDRVISAA
jgi:hypothetical protein